ncbi:hypothetical protein N7453_004256 [Penicillium expansum]|nr:hypothetical protein N7453_004256 [Penicillium expansum]
MGKSSLYRVHNWYGAVQNLRRSVSRLTEEGPLDSDVVKQECASLIGWFPEKSSQQPTSTNTIIAKRNDTPFSAKPGDSVSLVLTMKEHVVVGLPFQVHRIR